MLTISSLGAGPTPACLFALIREEETKNVLLVVGISVWGYFCGFFK